MVQEKDLVLIFPEPHGNDKIEQKRYIRAKRLGGWEQVVQEVDSVTLEYVARGQAASGFHKRTMELLGEIFGSQDKSFRYCYFTELTKCQVGNKGSIPPGTRQECLGRYLRRELEIIKPRAVLLFGQARKYQAQVDEILRTTGRTVLAEHPSARPPRWLHHDSIDRKRIVEELCRLLDLSPVHPVPTKVTDLVYRPRGYKRKLRQVGSGDVTLVVSLLEIIAAELPVGSDIEPSKERASLSHPLFEHLIGQKKKLVKMFIRTTQGVHVMCPPPLLKRLGYELSEDPDRDGDQKVIWPINQVEVNARKLGRDLATLL